MDCRNRSACQTFEFMLKSKRHILGSLGLAMVLLLQGCSPEDESSSEHRPSLSSSGSMTCFVDDVGVLRCWGEPFLGDEEAEDPLANRGIVGVMPGGPWESVSVGRFHACAIDREGIMWCWGQGTAGQLGDETRVDRREPTRIGGTAKWQAVAVGGYHTCALRSAGALYCWGEPDYNGGGSAGAAPSDEHAKPVQVPGRWKQVSAHSYSACAIREDDTLWCWGRHGEEQHDDSLPVKGLGQVGGGKWRGIAVGVLSSVAIGDDGSLWTLPTFPSEDGEFVATQVGTDLDWGLALAADYHQCAIRTDQTLWCVGKNTSGQLGTGDKGRSYGGFGPLSQVGEGKSWAAVVAGSSHTCAQRVWGTVECWGSNANGQLGLGDYPYRPSPARVGGASLWQSISFGSGFACGQVGTQVWCWGRVPTSSWDDDRARDQLEPVSPLRFSSFSAVHAGSNVVCGISTPGRNMSCWSRSRFFNGGSPAEARGLPFRAFGKGSGLCAIADSGRLLCFDYRGDATVDELGTWQSVSSTRDQVCAIDEAGSLYCRRTNRLGEERRGEREARHTMSRVGDEAWLAVAVGGEQACGIKDEGEGGHLYCWDVDKEGSLAQDRPKDQASLPTQVGDNDTWTSLSVGPERACGIRGDDSLWCWGRNHDGGLGIGVSDDLVHGPTRIGEDLEWARVTVGEQTCATTRVGSNRGALYCWGRGTSGELGDGTAWRLTPTLVDWAEGE